LKIKKYTASTEQEAIEKVKDELGLDALVLNIKKIQPRGIMVFFKKPLVEITAAYDDKKEKNDKPEESNIPLISEIKHPVKPQEEIKVDKIKVDKNIVDSDKAIIRHSEEHINKAIASQESEKITEQEQKIKLLEKKLTHAEDLIGNVLANISIESSSKRVGARKYDNSMIQVFYEVLVENGVTQEIASTILEDANILEEEVDINLIVKIAYNEIVRILGDVKSISNENKLKDTPKILAFFGPTGVGKTTTIAKLTSDFVLNKNLRVGLITVDTYRIAAVEQLKTYADILSIDVGVAYNNKDLKDIYENMKQNNDLILIDTAGRSHKNNQNIEELQKILNVIPECDKFLVLSTTTKYEDLVSIINSYSVVSDFELIFTKLDETNSIGSILNITYLMGKKIAYTTFGQDIPDDIEETRPEKIAKSLLGLGE
jgi:flagellar biosynthesis protein FlhF